MTTEAVYDELQMNERALLGVARDLGDCLFMLRDENNGINDMIAEVHKPYYTKVRDMSDQEDKLLDARVLNKLKLEYTRDLLLTRILELTDDFSEKSRLLHPSSEE